MEQLEKSMKKRLATKMRLDFMLKFMFRSANASLNGKMNEHVKYTNTDKFTYAMKPSWTSNVLATAAGETYNKFKA